MNAQEEIIREFLIETYESADDLEQQLVLLEETPDDPEIINRIFRIVHSIKGTCGFLGYTKLERLTHIGETLLDDLRSGKIVISEAMATALLDMGDAIRENADQIESTRSEGSIDHSELEKRLSDLQFVKPISLSEEQVVCEEDIEISAINRSETGEDYNCFVNERIELPPDSDPQVEDKSDQQTELDELEMAFLAAQAEYQTQEGEEEDVVSASAEDEVSNLTPMELMEGDTKMEKENADEIRLKRCEKLEDASSPEIPKSTLADSSLRVDVSLLDQLMNLVGELVLARNQILQFTKTQTDTGFVSTSQRLNLITSELQEGVMKTRMQPIANVWNKFPRIVRDLSKSCGKEVEIHMEGKDTDLDKTIIEAIKDPLTHIIRNSVDHGIETPEVREKNGKARCGSLDLKAYHEGGHVIIEIVDDGAGLDRAKVQSKAIAKGLVSSEQARKMTESEVFRLLFKPGFSTAEKITNISGRGVGMDVVRSNIEKIGGSVDLQSKTGAGTTVFIKIPLTLAIVDALIVTTGEQRFAIPQVSLVELLRVQGDNIATQIEEINGAHFYRRRGSLLPLVYLSQELKMSKFEELDENNKEDAVVNIVVVKSDTKQFGLVVGKVHDTEEIVVKPLGKQLKNIQVYAGATIMGDGKVALIIDVLGLAEQAGVLKKDEEARRAECLRSVVEKNDVAAKSLLLVKVGSDYRFAIPLESVARLEEFNSEQVERASGHDVVQYRNGILPLLDLPAYFDTDSITCNGVKHVVVHSQGERNVGFVVDAVLDIVEESVSIKHNTDRRGIKGSSIIQGKVTDLLNLDTILQDMTSGIQ